MYIIDFIKNLEDITVVTNSLRVANGLARRDIKVYVTGGKLFLQRGNEAFHKEGFLYTNQKFGKTSVYSVCHTDEVDIIISEQ